MSALHPKADIRQRESDKGASCGRGGSKRNKQRELGAEGRGWQRQFTTQLF
jgi:hypothetical protein